MEPLITFSLSFFVLVLSVYILFIGKSIFLPLVIAAVVGFFMISLIQGMRKITLFGRPFPYFLAYAATFIVMGGAVWLTFSVISQNVYAMLELAPGYQEKLNVLITAFTAKVGMKEPPNFSSYFKTLNLDLVSLTSNIFLSLKDFAGSMGLVTFYVVFILIEHHFFESKLTALLNEENSRSSARKLIGKIVSKIQLYLRIKTFLGLLTAVSCYAVLIAVGVDFPNFWAFLIFILNFIPTIGPLIATIFPCLLTLLQFMAPGPFIAVAAGLISIQMIIGNVLEPKVMSSSFNLSPLVIILSLTFWGSLWGIVGMFLCVPIIVILSIILANFPSTRPMAILLSQDGRVDKADA